jgi:hypothetical protein
LRRSNSLCAAASSSYRWWATSLSATTPAKRADVRRGAVGSRAGSFFTFFFGAEDFVEATRFSGLGATLIADNPTSLED